MSEVGQHQTLLWRGKILDGTGAPPNPCGDVLTDGERIAYVGEVADHGVENDIEVVDILGCTVLPGLIDTHVHLFDEGHIQPLDPGGAYTRGASRLLSAINGGITTARDVGSPYTDVFNLRDAVNANRLAGPRILAAGAAICAVGGHTHGTLAVEAKGPKEVKQRVLEQIAYGADVVKVMATSGAGLQHEIEKPSELTPAELRAAVVAAHDAGLPILSHAHSRNGIHDSLDAGVDGIEHGVFLDEHAIYKMLERDVTFTPTLSVYRRLASLKSQDPGPQRARRILRPHAEGVASAIRAGVRILMGTDSGGEYHPLGDVALELEMLVECGMTPVLAVHAATQAAAAACLIESEVGTLKRGKRADMLVVAGDVAADIRAIRDVRMVFRDGAVLVDRIRKTAHN